MFKPFYLSLIALLLVFPLMGDTVVDYSKGAFDDQDKQDNSLLALYKELKLEDHSLDYSLFEKAMCGMRQVSPKRSDVLSIIDFTKPSTVKRLYVIDLRLRRLAYRSYVSHGRNSGDLYATSFSNRHGSYKSSLGFYRTDKAYSGKNGFSLRLIGLEKGINDQALSRDLEIHGASYCDPSLIKRIGRLGRSYGCPTLPQELVKPIIDTIKDGSILYIYANDPTYLSSSHLSNSHNKSA